MSVKMTQPSAATLVINEIYKSVQGESSHAGFPCTFVRLAYCDLRCVWCDSEHTFYKGDKMSLATILDEVKRLNVPMVEVTGGEPLLQPNVHPLMTALADQGCKVLLETSGAHDISPVDPRVHTIMDLKCPDSGMCGKNRLENIPLLQKKDEVKFVLASRKDYEWARNMIARHDIEKRAGEILLSAVFTKIDPKQIVEWLLADHLPVRFQLQMHKYIWEPTTRGV